MREVRPLQPCRSCWLDSSTSASDAVSIPAHLCLNLCHVLHTQCRRHAQALKDVALASEAECIFEVLGYQSAFEILVRDSSPDGAAYLTTAKRCAPC